MCTYTPTELPTAHTFTHSHTHPVYNLLKWTICLKVYTVPNNPAKNSFLSCKEGLLLLHTIFLCTVALTWSVKRDHYIFLYVNKNPLRHVIRLTVSVSVRRQKGQMHWHYKTGLSLKAMCMLKLRVKLFGNKKVKIKWEDGGIHAEKRWRWWTCCFSQL